MRSPIVRAALIVGVLLLFVAGALFFFAGRAGTPRDAQIAPAAAQKPAGATATAGPSPSAQITPTGAPQAKPTTAQANPTSAPAQAKPTTAAAAPAKPADPASAKPADPGGIDRERFAREATWTPGQLTSHFEKHGDEGPWASESVYDASARETVRMGTLFTYVDRESNAQRLGFYDKAGNRFTSLTQDGRRITTHFRPDRGESYVRSLTRSTYRP